MDEKLTFNQPWILQRADPYVYRHTDGMYYFTASVLYRQVSPPYVNAIRKSRPFPQLGEWAAFSVRVFGTFWCRL